MGNMVTFEYCDETIMVSHVGSHAAIATAKS